MKGNTLSVVVLAAGKGTRMKSDRAKVLHEVFHRPMLHHVLRAVEPLNPGQVIAIVGHQEEAVRSSLEGFEVTIVRQEQQLGTGHAVLVTKDAIARDTEVVMILCGDTPLIRSSSLNSMIEQYEKSGAVLTLMTTQLDNPTGYGRILTEDGSITAIVEEKDASAEQKLITEINAGIYLVERNILFKALESITTDNSQGEFYLTDIVEYIVRQKKSVTAYLNRSPLEVLGVNSRVELEAAHAALQVERNRALMMEGVSIVSSASVSVSPQAHVGKDTQLHQNVCIEGKSSIGEKCVLENGAIVRNSHIGDNVRIGAYSVLENQVIEEKNSLPPHSILV